MPTSIQNGMKCHCHCSELPDRITDGYLGHFKTRPTNMHRARQVGEEKAAKGVHGFHAPAICFHPKLTSKVELEKVLADMCKGTANEITNKLYLLAENHNVLSSKHAGDICRKNGEIEKVNKYFYSFECYVLVFPTRDPTMNDDRWLNHCKQIFRYVSLRLFSSTFGIFSWQILHVLCFLSGR